MAIITTATLFSAGCLALGLGLFLIAGSVRNLHQVRLLPSVSAVTAAALGGALLVAAGAYAARLAVHL
ncbi:MAG: hypothetical protein Q7T33_04630 [Dehalococcoidia bacterium]|nr:hypothetical protein [Dehalococcoidia bacterium]